MKWKLTLKYLLSTVIVAMIIVILNIIIAMGIFISLNINSNEGNGILANKENLVRDFSKNIVNIKGGIDNVHINEDGKIFLDENNMWIQILDNDGNVIYGYNTAKVYKTKYSPIELITTYKYMGVDGNDSTVLAGEKIINNYSYSYLMGFPMRDVKKINIMFDQTSTVKLISKITTSIIIVDIIVATVIGYIFSKSLTKPVKTIINGVEDLSDRKYDRYYKEKGIYKPVFKKLNSLSDTLKENEKERRKIESMRNEWIANISHDIKTPLASIKGYAEIIEEGYSLDPKYIKEYANIIDSKANYIKELVDDLNLTMKLKNGYSDIERKEKNIVALVRNVVIDILNDSNYKNVDIDFECSEEKIVKLIDELLMKRVINNLLYNAILHNKESISIRVSIIGNIDNRVHIIIADNGKGIPNEELKCIFERYYRGTNTGYAHKGSGLGMAIARDIVKAHNGDITIESTLGEGTKLEIIM